MKTPLLKTLSGFLFVLFICSANGQPVEWKHYEYPDINLKFDLPADYEFEYPDDGTIAFKGYNSLTTFYFKRIEATINTAEERMAALYGFGSFTNDSEEDGNFQSGITAPGYLFAGTVVYVHDLDETAVAMLLTDPKNSNLNFFIFVTYGGEGNPDSPAYNQARTILSKFGPIDE